MRQMKAAGIDVVSLDWWGPGSPEDSRAPLVLDAARTAGLKVHFLVEPYWKTLTQLDDGLASLNLTYGSHPALLKLSRSTQNSPTVTPRPVVMFYAPPLNPSSVIDRVRGTALDSIFLIRGDDSKMLTDAGVRQVLAVSHADGLFNYSDVVYQGTLPSSPDYLLAWNVRPGFDNRRRPGTTNPVVIPRNSGATYDAMWKPLVDQHVEWVAVNSFNEWHEGSQIEPTQPWTYRWWFFPLYTYENYGSLPQNFYLDRTAYWTAAYKA